MNQNDRTPKYNHIKKEFGDIVNKSFPKLDILNYYPYGKEKYLTAFFYDNYDLTKAYLEKHNKNKTELMIAFEIISEVARAMQYLMTHGNDNWFDHQRIKAFALCKLFESGIVDWTKTPLEGLNLEEQIKLYKYHMAKYQKLFAYKDEKIFTKKQIHETMLHNLKEHGVLEVKYFPLTQFLNSCGEKEAKLFYNKKQLCAIKHYVDCAFENLC
jgi:hypothetical protein